ncbi:MAG: 2-C-methyl-D-erythritol 4-phosphate cytidylyltransferase [Micropruina sp.]
MEPVVALVVAAGSGVRLGGDVPKALRDLQGRTLVARSVDALAAGGVSHAIIVIAAGLEDDFRAALTDAPIPAVYAVGGAERQDSVANGLAMLPQLLSAPPRIVLVHDAARALVPASVVAAVIAAVRAGAKAVVPVVPLADSVRQLGDEGSRPVDRATLRAVQTPQGFDLTALIEGHLAVLDGSLAVTDDAMACEAAGYAVALVPGSHRALKITTPIDLVIAEALLQEDA